MNPDTILYVEDDETDVYFMKRAFEFLGPSYCLRVVRKAVDAMDYLNGSPRYSDRQEHPLPSLVLLDLKLPGAKGIEVLDWIRRHHAFKMLPVVVFTASTLEGDRRLHLEHGANDYITKPADMNDIPEILAPMLERFLHPGAGKKEAA